MIGSPVIIEHQDVTDKNADKIRCGVISDAYFNEPDGWYYAEGIIWDDKAISLINDGWSVSCSYDFLAFNDEGGEENNIKYDKEFTELNFTHLAIVNNPRYERANIVFNSKVENDKWITIHPNGEDAKGRPLLLKDGETPREALARAYGVDEAKGQQKLFPTKEFKKTREDFQREEQEQKDIFAQHQKKLETKYRNMEFAGTENPDELQDLSGEDVDFEEWEDKKQSDTKGQDNNKKTYNQYFSDKRTGMSMYDDVLNDEHYANTKQRFPKVITMSPQKYIDTVADGFDKMHVKYDDNPIRVTSEELVKSRTDEKLNKLREKFGKEPFDMPMIGYEMQKDRSTDMAFQEGIHRAILAKEAGLKEIPVAIYSTGRYGEKFTNEELKNNLDKVIKNLFNNKTNNSKEQDMKLLDELKKLITKVENNKENEEMIDNEKVDKRKLIDEVGGILKGKVDDEIIRTIIKKMEEASYNDSEASADNKKVKNEDDEEKKIDNEEDEKEEVKNKKKVKNEEDEEDEEKVEELKKEEKKDVENKCKNSKETSTFDKINAIYNSVRALKPQTKYTSRQEKLDNAVEYFKN